jgi:hypothetical protein
MQTLVIKHDEKEMKIKKGWADGSLQITDDYYDWSVSTERVCRRAGGSERWKPAGAQDKARLSEERENFSFFTLLDWVQVDTGKLQFN